MFLAVLCAPRRAVSAPLEAGQVTVYKCILQTGSPPVKGDFPILALLRPSKRCGAGFSCRAVGDVT